MANQGRKELFAVIERGDGERGFWVKIGAAFENRDGSWSLVFDAFPTNGGRVQMRDPYDPDRDGGRREDNRNDRGGDNGEGRDNSDPPHGGKGAAQNRRPARGRR